MGKNIELLTEFCHTVNGKKAEIEKVNAGFMAVVVPKGISTIEFTYTTPGLSSGIAISVFALFILLVYIMIFKFFIKKKNSEIVYPEGEELLLKWRMDEISEDKKNIEINIPDDSDNRSEKATDNTFGIVKPDKTTTTISNGELIVKTSGLDKIGKGGGYGIVRTAPFETTGDPVYGDGGFIRLKTKEMTKASIYATKSTQNGFGVCAVDGKTMISDNGVLKVDSPSLRIRDTAVIQHLQ